MDICRLGGNKQQRQSHKHLRKPFIIRNISTSDLRFHDMVDPNGSNPMSTKTWLDIWSVDLEELAKERSENIKNDFKYLKLKAVLDLCRSGAAKESRDGISIATSGHRANHKP
ncbi:hypothetical protein G4B88_014830 [Cannabis sativa]|uniref:Uncharacterized protein n=1 Tax=Cannabis sativa TaxID=3483 RepID=A0A7J6I9V1_CANSA|nr:hypothetical protein G4B88_014830 [Cannabis sativa]